MPKFVVDRSLVQVMIATLISDRALLLIGEPGTAKSWLSEHLSAPGRPISDSAVSSARRVSIEAHGEAEGKPRAAALRASKRETAARRIALDGGHELSLANPVFWPPFVLVAATE